MPTEKQFISGYDEPTHNRRSYAINLFPKPKEIKFGFVCEICHKTGRLEKKCCGQQRVRYYKL